MAEQFTGPDRRAPRPVSVAGTTAAGLTGGLGVAWLHWLSTQYVGGHFVWTMPPMVLLEVTVGALAPTIHLAARAINHQLERAAGETT